LPLLKKENEQTLLNERLRISRDLHDDMGATLSSISVYSAAVKQRLLNGNKTEAIAMLDRISEDAQEMVSNMGDMVWMINPQNDSVAKLLERMQNYSINLLLARQIEFGFSTGLRTNASKAGHGNPQKHFFVFLKKL
jgi:signal transduction histidine kinase